MLSRLVPHKQVEHVLEAAAALRERHPTLEVDVIGDGWWRPRLLTLAAELGLEEVVTFHGHVPDDVRDRLLARAWVMALPSVTEGWGIAVDAVVADFLAGAAERLVLEGAKRGDLLWVEGQGSLVHPYYSAVTLGLYHGAMPHLLVLCHKAGDTHIEELPGHPIPPLPDLVELYERVALPARPARVAAIALNTMNLAEEAAARRAIAEAEEAVQLVADDPVRFDAGRLVDAVLERLPARR